MADRPRFSAQTLSVLAALEADPTGWLHGYLVAKQTGLASGTLYPILIRLAERHLIEALESDLGVGPRHVGALGARGIVAITDQRICHPQGEGIERATGRNTGLPVTRPTRVLD